MASDGGIVTPTRITAPGPGKMGGGHTRSVEKASTIVEKEEEEDDRGQEEMNAPVDLVCTKHKYEPTVTPSRLDSIPDSSLALSLLMRRRRRGRARYAPFPCSGCTSHTTDLSPGLSSALSGGASLPLSGRTGSGQFVCPHCKSVFPNRDALAMHMLDSVRSDGVCGGSTSNATSNSIPVSIASTTTSPSAVSANGPVSSSTLSGNSMCLPSPATATSIPLPNVASTTGSQVNCRVCAKTLPSLDSLAMHMLAHAHQEGLHSVMQRVASHYSDLLQHSFVPQVPPHSGLPPLPVSAVVAPLQIPTDRRSPVESNTSCSKIMDENGKEEASSQMVVVKLEEDGDDDEKCSKGEEEEENGMTNVAGSEENQEEPDVTQIAVTDEEEDDEDCTTGQGVVFPFVCRHCLIAFADRTMYCLHMGLHNVNHPWQCNMCGKSCSGRHEFTSHVLHF